MRDPVAAKRIRLVFRKLRPAGRLRKFAWITLWVAGGGALVAGTFVVAFVLAMKSELRSTEVKVPDLETLPLADAERTVEPAGLRLEIVDRRHDPTTPSGRVLQQSPAAGASVRRGRKVKVVVSLGGRVLEVPDLRGRADRTAAISLERDGLAAGDEARVHAAGVPAGRVVAQVPAAGSPAVPAARVHRLVSEGDAPVRWVMPDLTGLSRTAAERWVELCGFRLGPVRRVPGRGRRAGVVVGQHPLAGYPVRTRDVVELSVSR